LLPGKVLYYPEFTKDLHYECELVVRISSNGKFIQEKFAHKYYDAITLGIDYTARDVQIAQQKKGLPWEIAKAFDGSAVVGTFAKVTEETDLTQLEFRLEKNGVVVQTGNTSDMIFSVNSIIAYASRFFTFNIGDLIFTGTPAGVGPVAIGDKLEGYMMGSKVLETEVR
jgi:acylpyruvate hydrolase